VLNKLIIFSSIYTLIILYKSFSIVTTSTTIFSP